MIRAIIIVLVLSGLIVTGCTKPGIDTSDQVPTPQQEPSTPPVQPEPDKEPTSTTSRSPADTVPRITIDELLQKMEGNGSIIIVDTREEPELQYDIEHIKGAVSAPLSVITAGKWRPENINQEIIFYCS